MTTTTTPDHAPRRSQRLARRVPSDPRGTAALATTLDRIGADMTEVFETRDGRRGAGLRARVPIWTGTVVARYCGELLSQDEAERRERDLEQRGEYSSCYMFWFQWRARWMCVDATDPQLSNCTRYINHSRQQANLRPVLMRSDEDGRPIIAFKATRDIDAGEELLFDYGDRRRCAVRHNPWLRE